MKRSEIEHVLRAAGAVTLQEDFVVIGSQSILASHPDAPDELLGSIEVDLYPRLRPADSILIDGAIGEGSMFHHVFGYYAHGVGPQTATLPDGWESRLVSIRNENTRGVTGWCLEVHDLAFSKLSAGRDKDLEFIRALLRHDLIDGARLERLLVHGGLAAERRDLLLARLVRIQRPRRESDPT